jgi:integrative and conjugative element protein (TIGR02256 family)
VIVWLERDVLCILESAARRRCTEAGGGLFGYVADGAVVVEAVTVARGRSQGTATSFRPDAEDLQKQIDTAIRESDGLRYLVGEWHTHPTGRPYLSPIDVGSVRRTATNPKTGLSRPVAVVLAPTAKPRTRPDLAAFVWEPASGRALRTEVRPYVASADG